MLEQILAIASLVIDAIGAVSKGNPTATEQAILKIVQAGAAAYQSHTGQPIDPSQLAPLPPV
jgi:hypothetical protein